MKCLEPYLENKTKKNQRSPAPFCRPRLPLHVSKIVNERTNLFLLHCVSRPSRSIVRENTKPKETRQWHIIIEGREERVGSVPRYSEYHSGKTKNEKTKK